MPMARPVKSFSELQLQFIGAELERREADTRKDALDALRNALDDVAIAPPPVKALPTDR